MITGISNLSDGYRNLSPVGASIYYPNILLASIDTGEIFHPINEPVSSLRDVVDESPIDVVVSATNLRAGRYFFFGYNTENYYHFVYDTLPYLIPFLELRKEYPDMKLLMQYPNESRKEHYKFVTEFLALLNITGNDIEIIDRNNYYEFVYISDSLTYGPETDSPPENSVYELHKRISSAFVHRTDFPKKIYVSRRTHLHGDASNIGTNYTTRRRLVNEDELVDFLTLQGYVEVFTELLTTEDKISMFANATHVVGAIGGGICNVLFSPPSTELIALISPGFLDINKRFIHSLNRVKLTLFTDTWNTEETEFKTHMRVQSGKIVGEITKVSSDKLTVMYSDEKVAGWNAETKYSVVELDAKECRKLDNGLNSPWQVNLEKLKEIV